MNLILALVLGSPLYGPETLACVEQMRRVGTASRLGRIAVDTNALDTLVGYVDQLRGAGNKAFRREADNFEVQFIYPGNLQAGFLGSGIAVFRLCEPAGAILEQLYAGPDVRFHSDGGAVRQQLGPAHSAHIPGATWVGLADLLEKRKKE